MDQRLQELAKICEAESVIIEDKIKNISLFFAISGAEECFQSTGQAPKFFISKTEKDLSSFFDLPGVFRVVHIPFKEWQSLVELNIQFIHYCAKNEIADIKKEPGYSEFLNAKDELIKELSKNKDYAEKFRKDTGF